MVNGAMVRSQRHQPIFPPAKGEGDQDSDEQDEKSSTDSNVIRDNALAERTQTLQANFPKAEAQKLTKKCAAPVRSPPSQNLSHKLWPILAVIVAGLAAASAYWYGGRMGSLRHKTDIMELKKVFKEQDPDFWNVLQAASLPSKVEAVKTFLFLHSSRHTSDCFLKSFAEPDCDIYRAEDLSFDPKFVEKVTNNLREQKCMVIHDMEKLSTDGITVLKGFCDAYTPVVPNSKFYFALYSENRGNGDYQQKAYEILESKWSKSATSDDFGGTVTRLTQNVLNLREEKEPC